MERKQLLVDVPYVNSHVVYMKLDNDTSLLNFNIIAAKALNSRYSNCKISFPTSRPTKEKSHESSISTEVATQMHEFKEKRMMMMMISDTPQAGFELAQELSSGCVDEVVQ